MSAAATTPRRTAAVLLEDFAPGTRSRVDRARGVVRGVKVLGVSSTNGRHYPLSVMREAKDLYEGLAVYIDHPDKPTDRRHPDDKFGELRNIEVRSDGMYGDLHYLRSHPLAERLAEAAEHMPSAYGLSHNAACQCEKRGDKLVVTKIEYVRSVDLVTEPATVSSLFESRGDAGFDWADDEDRGPRFHPAPARKTKRKAGILTESHRERDDLQLSMEAIRIRSGADLARWLSE